MQQPPNYQQPFYNQPPVKRPDHTRRNAWLIIIAIVLVGFLIIGALQPPPATQTTASTPTATPTQAAVLAATATPTDTPVPTNTPVPTATPQPVHYPPKTQADLQSLAAKGDASAIHEFHSESTGMTGACPQPKREVTVNPSLTGQRLAEDLLAYFYAQQLDSPCGSLVLAYHNQGEANDVYTAGRILFQVTDSSGQINSDPNATNLKHTLTLDTGDFATSQESVVKY